MKLRNKKTGKIKEVQPLAIGGFRSLTELNEEWEDYEEPKEYWFINTYEGTIVERTIECFEMTDKERKEIGNYFETREEAEKAVEKLKAWKRLKDKDYYFSGWKVDKLHFEIELRVKEYDFVTDEVKHDMNLLFGGEE